MRPSLLLLCAPVLVSILGGPYLVRVSAPPPDAGRPARGDAVTVDVPVEPVDETTDSLHWDLIGALLRDDEDAECDVLDRLDELGVAERRRCARGLVSFLTNRDASIRSAARAALESLEICESDCALPAILEAVLATEGDRERRLLLDAADGFHFPDDLPPRDADHLAAAATGAHPSVRAAVLRIFAEAGELTSRARSFAACSLLDSCEDVRKAAFEAIWGDGFGDAERASVFGHALRAKNTLLRRWVIHQLGETADEWAIPLLSERLFDPDAGVRRAAATVLLALGWDMTSVRADMLRVLDDPDPLLRQVAVWALGDIGDARDAGALGKALLDTDPEVRVAATEGLTYMGEAARPTVPALRIVLRDAEPEVRANAAYVLGELGDEGALRELIAMLRDPCADVRWSATVALGNLGRFARPAVPALAVRVVEVRALEGAWKSAVEAIRRIDAAAAIEVLAREVEETGRQEAIRLLGKAGAAARSAVPALGAALVRGADAGLALARIGGPEACAALVRGLRLEPRPERRLKLAEFLVSFGPEAQVAAADIARLFRERVNPVPVASVLARIGGEDARRALWEVHASPDGHLRRVALDALADPLARTTGRLSLLRRDLRSDDADTRSAALFALGLLGPDAAPAAPEILDALCAAEEGVRGSAAWALARIRPSDERITQRLRALLGDPDDHVRLAAAWALAHLPGTGAEAAESLAEFLRSRNCLVRKIAAWGLDRMGRDAAAAVPRLVSALVSALGNAHGDTPVWAAWALAHHASSPEVVVALRRTLEKNRSAIVRLAATGSLLHAGPYRARALTALRSALASSSGDLRARTVAAAALLRAGIDVQAALGVLSGELSPAAGPGAEFVIDMVASVGPAAAPLVPDLERRRPARPYAVRWALEAIRSPR
jgi:HEAT repeat protein